MKIENETKQKILEESLVGKENIKKEFELSKGEVEKVFEQVRDEGIFIDLYQKVESVKETKGDENFVLSSVLRDLDYRLILDETSYFAYKVWLEKYSEIGKISPIIATDKVVNFETRTTRIQEEGDKKLAKKLQTAAKKLDEIISDEKIFCPKAFPEEYKMFQNDKNKEGMYEILSFYIASKIAPTDPFGKGGLELKRKLEYWMAENLEKVNGVRQERLKQARRMHEAYCELVKDYLKKKERE